MGSIYKRGKTYWIKYYRGGQPYRESSKSTKKMVANELLKTREGEIAQGKIPGIHFDKVKFDDLAEDYLRDYRINHKKSLVRAEISTTRLKEFFGGMKLPSVNSPNIGKYIETRLKWACNECGKKFDAVSECPVCGSDDLKPGVSNATINRELAALKRMLNLGAKQTPPKVDRVPYIPPLKENNIRKGFFEHGEFLALCDTLPSYLKGFATFAYKTGWRVSEMLMTASMEPFNDRPNGARS